MIGALQYLNVLINLFHLAIMDMTFTNISHLFHGENLYHLKDFHGLESLDHHKQLLQVPTQACLRKCSRHHLDSTIRWEHLSTLPALVWVKRVSKPIGLVCLDLLQSSLYKVYTKCTISRSIGTIHIHERLGTDGNANLEEYGLSYGERHRQLWNIRGNR